MKGMKIWIPGEECDGGLLVNDAQSGEDLLVREGEVGRLVIPIKRGRFIQKPAIRGVVRSTTNNYVLARLADGHVIGVRIVAGWQIGDGDGTPPDADGAMSTRAAPSDSVTEATASEMPDSAA